MPNQVIVAFVLPERCMATEDTIRLISGEALERAQPFPCWHRWSNQEMDVVGHYDECVELISMEARFAVVESLDHKPGYFR